MASDYIDKEAFYKAIVEYKKQCRKALKAKKPKPQIPSYIAQCIMLIAENVANMPRYNRYSFKDIMISDAIENCVRYFDNFDVNRPEKNPFGYFSQYCLYAFNRRISIEKKELYTKYKMVQQSGVLDEQQAADMEENGEDGIQENQMYENINEFIGKFEESLKRKKDKAKKPKGVGKFEEL